jgi:hypothetical protein
MRGDQKPIQMIENIHQSPFLIYGKGRGVFSPRRRQSEHPSANQELSSSQYGAGAAQGTESGKGFRAPTSLGRVPTQEPVSDIFPARPFSVFVELESSGKEEAHRVGAAFDAIQFEPRRTCSPHWIWLGASGSIHAVDGEFRGCYGETDCSHPGKPERFAQMRRDGLDFRIARHLGITPRGRARGSARSDCLIGLLAKIIAGALDKGTKRRCGKFVSRLRSRRRPGVHEPWPRRILQRRTFLGFRAQKRKQREHNEGQQHFSQKIHVIHPFCRPWSRRLNFGASPVRNCWANVNAAFPKARPEAPVGMVGIHRQQLRRQNTD